MSFRQFGGLNYAPKHNIVGSNYNTTNNLMVTQNVGQPNSYINFLSDISGNFIIDGNISATTANFSGSVSASSFINTSDYRIKENIVPLDNSFVVDNLNPITYTNSKTNKTEIGFIAHELQEQFPFLVEGVKDGEKLQTINYIGLIALLVKEIKDLKKEIKLIKQQK